MLSQVGKLHKCFVKPDTLELTDQCKEETGLTVDDIVKAEPLDKVLQQVSLTGLFRRIGKLEVMHTGMGSCSFCGKPRSLLNPQNFLLAGFCLERDAI